MATKQAAKKDPAAARKRTEANRERKLLKLMKEQPNNKQLDLAFKRGFTPRKAPVKSVWSHSAKRAAQLIKMFKGRFNKDVFATDIKLQQLALNEPSAVVQAYKGVAQTERDMFSIKTRATSLGTYQWK